MSREPCLLSNDGVALLCFGMKRRLAYRSYGQSYLHFTSWYQPLVDAVAPLVIQALLTKHTQEYSKYLICNLL